MLNIVFQDSEHEVILSNIGMDYNDIRLLHPDLLLIDVNIKGFRLRGDAICQVLKSHADTHDLPVFLVSGEDHLDHIANACHANGFFSKPLNLKDLKSTVLDTLAAS